jgi:ricin-type beta-trefoil lectin protein
MMRRSRFAAWLFTVVAALATSLAIAAPAHADTLGPIQNVGNGLCMQPEGNSAAQGALIVQQPCDQFTTGQRNLFQEWDGVCKDANCSVFFWRNRGSQLCMRARGLTGPANGEQIMLWACNQISDVNWVFGRSPIAGTFVLESRLSRSTGFCLDVPGQSQTPGQALQLFRCNQTVAQIWQAPAPIIE